MADLSPAAAAMLDACNDAVERLPLTAEPEQFSVALIAAALRAAACQIAPHISRTPWITNDDGYFNETFENLEALGELNSSLKLLSIAAELEGQL
jgi:hypothetical protein